MLILSRKIEEAIYIGNNAEIRVHVLGVQGHNVRLGIEAPREVPVHREEIYRRIQAEKEGNGNIDTDEGDNNGNKSDE